MDLNESNQDQQLNSLIQQMAQKHQPTLPTAGAIWWRAQIQKKLAEKERIERPMVIMRMVSTVVCVVLMAAAVAASRNIFRETLADDHNVLLVGLLSIAGALGLLFLGSILFASPSKS